MGTLALAFGMSACDRFSGLKNNNKFAFKGAQSFGVEADGTALVRWAPPEGFSLNSSVTYSVYMQVLDAAGAPLKADDPAAPQNPATTQQIAQTGLTVTSALAAQDEVAAPVVRGSLLGTFKSTLAAAVTDSIKQQGRYAFQVRALGPNGEQDGNQNVVIVTVTQKSLSFLGLQSVEFNDAKIELKWQPADPSTAVGKVYYKVYEGTDFTTVIDTVEATALSIPMGTRPAGSEWSYGVRAFDSRNVLDQNAVVKLVKLVMDLPLEFGGLTEADVIIAPSREKITISWQAALNPKSSVRYIVYSDAGYSNAIGITEGLTFELLKPEAGVSYTFGVRAQDARGEDPNRNFVVRRMPPLPKAPDFAGLSNVIVDDKGTPILTWNPATDDVTAGTDLIYKVYRSVGAFTQDFAAPIAVLPNQFAYRDEQTDLGQTYYYIVRATDAEGNEEKNQKQVSALAAPVLTFSGLDNAADISDSRAELSWKPATGAIGSIFYRIYQDRDMTKVVGTTSAARYTATGLAAEKTYSFTVRAVDSARDEENNAVTRSITTRPLGYAAFDGVKTIQTPAGIDGQTKVILTWKAATPPTNCGTPCTIRQYNIYAANTPGGQDFGVPTASTGLQSYTLQGLESDRNFYIVVRALASTDLEEENSVELMTRTSDVLPVAFDGVQAASRAPGTAGFTNILASWKPGIGSFNRYEVYLRTSASAFDFSAPTRVVDLSQTSVTLTQADGVQPNTQFYVIVRAIDSRRTAAEQDDRNVNEKAATTTPPPPSFGGIKSALLPPGTRGLSVAELTWEPAVGVFNGYRIFSRQPEAVGAAKNFDFSLAANGKDYKSAILSVAADTVDAQVTALTLGVRYCFAVRAVWSDGTSFLSDEQTPVTERCVRPTFVNPVFGGVVTVALDPLHPRSSLNLAWNAASGIYDTYLIALGTSAQNALDLADDPTKPCPVAFGNACRVSIDQAVTHYTVGGLPPNTDIYVHVRSTYTNTIEVPAHTYFDTNRVTAYRRTDSLANVAVYWEKTPVLGVPNGIVQVAPKVCVVTQTSLDAGTPQPITDLNGTVTLSLTPSNTPGTLSGNSATLVNGCASLPILRYADIGGDPTRPILLLASIPGIGSTPLTTPIQSAVGACTRVDPTGVFKTGDGGCRHSSGLVFSMVSGPKTWHEAIKGCTGTDCDDQEGVPLAGEDSSPTTGYCRDLVESGKSDWRLPAISELQAVFDATTTPISFLRVADGAGYFRLMSTTTPAANLLTYKSLSSDDSGILVMGKDSNYNDWLRPACVRGP